ncbi:MAG: DUF2189 domain-containing protein [Parvularculaceae bacterium]
MAESALPTVNRVGLGAPLRWLGEGWRDYLKAFAPCTIYGAFIAMISAALCWLLIKSNLAFWALTLSCGFVFAAPMLAMGLYAAGRMLERGERPTVRSMLFVREAVRSDVFYLGLALLLIYLLWGRVAQIVYGLSTYRLHSTVRAFTEFALNTSEGHAMLISGTIVGGILAFFTFSITVVSAPMLLQHDSNVFGAVFTSLRATSRSFAPMLLWAALITTLLLIAAATGFLALVVIFPWLGLASWRAYRDVVASSSV